MKYCHVPNLVSFSKQAILFHGLHNSASISMIFSLISPLPTHFLVKSLHPACQSGMDKLFAQVAKSIDLKVFTQLYYFIILVGVRVCSCHLCPPNQKSILLMPFSSDTEKWKPAQNFSIRNFYPRRNLANTFLVEENVGYCTQITTARRESFTLMNCEVQDSFMCILSFSLCVYLIIKVL